MSSAIPRIRTKSKSDDNAVLLPETCKLPDTPRSRHNSEFDFKVGDQVCYTNIKTDTQHSVTIKWKGIVESSIHPKRPLMFGIEFKTPIGKHDGRGLWKCKNNYGSLVLPKSLSKLVENINDKPSKRVRHDSDGKIKIKKNNNQFLKLKSFDNSKTQTAEKRLQQFNIQPPTKDKLVVPTRPSTRKKSPSRINPDQGDKELLEREKENRLSILDKNFKPINAENMKKPLFYRPPRRSKSVPRKIHHPVQSTPLSKESHDLEQSMLKMSLKLDESMIQRPTKRHQIYSSKYFTPDHKYKTSDCATGLPFKRNTPKKKVYRKNKPEEKSRDIKEQITK